MSHDKYDIYNGDLPRFRPNDDEVISSLMLYVKEKTKNFDNSHGFYHHIDVYLRCLEIYKGSSLFDRSKWCIINWGKTLMLIAALVHDIFDHKYEDVNELTFEQFKEDITLLFKSKCEIKPIHFVVIKDIIDNISYSKQVKGEINFKHLMDNDLYFIRNIVSDADKITALGLDGIERCKEYVRYKNPDFTELQVTEAVVKHCDEKLNNLINYIYTEKGIEIAEPLQQETLAWYDETVQYFTNQSNGLVKDEDKVHICEECFIAHDSHFCKDCVICSQILKCEPELVSGKAVFKQEYYEDEDEDDDVMSENDENNKVNDDN